MKECIDCKQEITEAKRVASVRYVHKRCRDCYNAGQRRYYDHRQMNIARVRAENQRLMELLRAYGIDPVSGKKL